VGLEFIIIGSFAVLVAGRLTWEKLSSKPAATPRPGEEREWFHAIK